MPSSSIRHPVSPRDVPAEKIARLLHLTLAQFDAAKAELYDRGFPKPDITTGHFDVVAVNLWMDARHPAGFGSLTKEPVARNAQEVFGDRARRLLNGH